jgi:hypothetical protein
MKNLANMLIILCAASLTTFASGIDGKWRSERQVGDADGKTYSHVSILNLKSEGSLLTGTVVWTSAAPWMRALDGKPFDIKDGKIDGEKFSFKIVHESERGERTSIYEGTVDGNRMKGIVKFRGIGQTWELDAQRID